MDYEEYMHFLEETVGRSIKAMWCAGESVLFMRLEDGRIIQVWGGIVMIHDMANTTVEGMTLIQDPETKPPITQKGIEQHISVPRPICANTSEVCPCGGAFGVDTDQFDECVECCIYEQCEETYLGPSK
jgi:hypothetical protein